jgi:hypothetical protein
MGTHLLISIICVALPDDLVAAVQSAVEPGEEALVVPIVDHLFQTRRVTGQTPSTPRLP